MSTQKPPPPPPIPPFTATDIEKPKRIAALRTYRGWPIPWFIEFRDGFPDFVTINPRKIIDALYNETCWICGQKLVGDVTFSVGPMSGVNLTAAEPPQHYDCAAYAVQVCPFLVNPSARRRDGCHEKTGSRQVEGGIDHNPGVMLLWTCKSFTSFDVEGGKLCKMHGPPVQAEWWRRGHIASRDEVVDAIDLGVAKIKAMIEEEEPANRAVQHAHLETCVGRLQPYLPAT